MKNKIIYLCTAFLLILGNYSCGENDNWVVIESETPPPVEKRTMYMIGGDFGSWDWASENIVELTPVNSTNDSVFWCVRYFQASNGFKLSPKKSWDNAFGRLTNNVGDFTNDNDGNVHVPTDGLYIVFVDLIADKLAVEPAKVFGMGDAFGGWNGGQYPFTVDTGGKTMSITTTGAGELRMYATSSATTADWWKMEFIILNGKIEYRGNGGDQERVSVAAGKKVTLDFNAGTGTIE